MSADVVFAPRWWRRTVAAIVGLLVAALIAAAVVDGFVRHAAAGAVVAAVLDLLGVTALFTRRRWPAPVLAFEVAVAVTSSLLPGAKVQAAAVFFAMLALYTFGTVRPSGRTMAVAAATAATVATVACVAEDGLGPLVPDLALFAAATAASFYVRSHRALMVSYRERAEQAEEAQQWIASRAVAAERVRLARELHDVVAHHVSLLVVQAGAVRETLPADHVTRPVLDSMIDGGRQAMSEMRNMLDALRLDAGSHEPLRDPQPRVDEIPALVTGAQCAGLPVTLQVDGEVVAAPPGASLAAYRIVQEALTNALKHAPGAFTTVRLAYEAHQLRITVRNGPSPLPASPPGRGHGVVGMRERAGLAHGTITVGPTTDGWEVDAHLPLGRTPATPAHPPLTLPAPS